ncbi:integrase arm-type DNA-binding domain-containing protein [Bradyrhizobium sp. 83012]|uniref:Integrase arm-type DNA-binding domain-containing protein n=1 Tax=Bradyrhizobium aeschynomenes TaxID=2734909 RepID=A0ABX2CAW8_9BRAD|nr:site-specific integrase [Bradyrhizobium aeschynomenes]NPU65384.1 integrase arm-type DNA-binding domain-containing protein [Bradyrhizobium aeschynomenes]
MAHLVGRLTALKAIKVKKSGMYADGAGLYLQVTGDGENTPAKSWIFRFTLRGRSREMGLGSFSIFGLAEARAKAAEYRRQVYEGIDPIEARRAQRAQAALEAAAALTFQECTKQYLAAHSAGWRNAKHTAQWGSTLKTYAEPVIGSLSVHAIDTALVMKIIEPLWSKKPETASRLRGRIEAVLDWATVRGFRQGENPARWRGHLDKLLPARAKVRKVKHHAALPFDKVPAFMTALRAQEGVAARALEFLILTAARTGEVIGARPEEFKDTVWTVPAGRMKASKEHRVPLSAAALAIVETVRTEPGDAHVFPGGKRDKPLSNMAMLALLDRMGRSDLTAHGFRSTFRDWAAECTNYPNEVVEMALAHTISSKVEAAYRRGDLFEKRKSLMSDWARFCVSSSDADQKIVSIRA